MSFRLRVLLLVVLVAVTATVATAWLTLRQASQQFNESATVDRAESELVGDRLREYGAGRGTWEGVVDLVMELRSQTGQRIHLVSEAGIVIVDTDTEEQRDARPLGTASVFVDPRPQLTMPVTTPDPVRAAAEAITSYRRDVLMAACLTRNDVDVTMSDGRLGVPRISAAWDIAGLCQPSEPSQLYRDVETELAIRCVDPVPDDRTPRTAEPETAAPEAAESPSDTPTDSAVGGEAGQGIVPPVPEELTDCLAQAFTEQISDVAPVPLRVHLGSRGDPAFRLATGPLLAAAAGVALVVVLGTVLLSHRVLRPIGTLTAAAHRLGRGDLTGRVPVRGNDELAELGRSFNRMADSLRRGEERQRRLVADVAHELRTPLANLRGYLEALADGVIAPGPEIFASLHEEAVLQQRIVNDLQDLALAEAGNLAYHRHVVDLAELLETCRTAHRALAESTGVTLAVHAGRTATGNGPVAGSTGALLVHADPDRLRQVMGNLITNALRATPAGGEVSLQVTAGQDETPHGVHRWADVPGPRSTPRSTGDRDRDRSGATVVIRVVDNGTGIDAAALPHVFDRFWRADPARGRRTGGGGLGLAIARQIVTDHGGTITVASAVGVGTTFTITLPAIG